MTGLTRDEVKVNEIGWGETSRTLSSCGETPGVGV